VPADSIVYVLLGGHKFHTSEVILVSVDEVILDDVVEMLGDDRAPHTDGSVGSLCIVVSSLHLGAGVRPTGLIKVREEFWEGCPESGVSLPFPLNLVNHLLGVGDDVRGNQDTDIGPTMGIDTSEVSPFLGESEPDSFPYSENPGLKPGAGNTGLTESTIKRGGGEVAEVSMDVGNHIPVTQDFLTEVVQALLTEFPVDYSLLAQVECRHSGPVLGC